MSSVIKSHGRDWRRLRGRVVVVESPASLPDGNGPVQEEEAPEAIAERIIADAEARAQEMIAAAQAEAMRLQESSRREGFARGMEEAEARWHEQFRRLEEQAEELRREHEELLEAAEPELAKLSLEIARKVLKQELSVNPEAVISVVRAAVHRIKDREVRILVSPRDLETVRAARENLIAIAEGVSQMDIVSDRRIGQGGCVLEMPSGNLDARIETQLAHIEEIIARECEGE